MGRVRFKKDYRGARTRELFYRAGTVDEFEASADLVAEGVAELVDDDVAITGPSEDTHGAPPKLGEGVIQGVSAFEGYKRDAQRQADMAMNVARSMVRDSGLL